MAEPSLSNDRSSAAMCALQQEKDRFRAAIEAVQGVLWTNDSEGRMLGEQPGWAALTGQAFAEYQGYGWASAVHSDDAKPTIDAWHQAVAERRTFTFEHRVRRYDGEWRLFAIHAVPLFDLQNGAIIEWVGVHTDITEQRHAEAAVKDMNAELELRVEARTAQLRDMAQQLEKDIIDLEDARQLAVAATAAKAAFLANMSHEIRTPMNGVMGFAELLVGTPLNAEQRRYVDMIADSGRSMMQLLNDILDISKIEAGQMRLAAEPVDIRHNMRSVVSLMEPAAAAKGISISSMIDDALPSLVVGDQLRLRQILINLVGNAVKFTKHGRVMLAATKTVDDAGARLLIEVQDTGIGIPADRLETIFEKFSQADTSIARDFGGTGLGLSITKQLVELMGGTLSVVSKVGEGTTFAVHLPFLLPLKSAEPVIRIVESPEPNFADGGSCARILVVEDHDINQALMQGLSKQLCTDLDIAANGEEALRMVHQAHGSDRPYDLVLMDMQMPVMDGLEATRRLRAAGFSPEDLPIVALTANAFAEDVAACYEAGMQGHLSKPVRKRDLQRVLSRFTDRGSPEKGRDVELEDSPLDEVISEPLQGKFVKRKQQTLDFLAQLANSRDDREADYERVIEMLHKLAGTAGIFGEPKLGEAASKVERALQASPPELYRDVVCAGWKQLSQAS